MVLSEFKYTYFVLDYNYIKLHMIDNLLFDVENLIILPSSIIHFIGL